MHASVLVVSVYLSRNVGRLRARRRLHAVDVDGGDRFELLAGAFQVLRRR